MKLGRTLRTAIVALTLAALGPVAFMATPAAAAPAAQELSGEGLGDKIMCAACIAGGLIAISGGLGVVMAVANSPAGQLAIIACVDACVEAYAE